MKHSQDRGTGIYRALRSIPAHEVDLTVDRIGDHRRIDLEAKANELYEELRLLTKEQLRARAGWKGGRQEMIATIIQEEVYGGQDYDPLGRTAGDDGGTGR